MRSVTYALANSDRSLSLIGSAGARLVVSDGDHKVTSTGPCIEFRGTWIRSGVASMLCWNEAMLRFQHGAFVVTNELPECLRSQSIAATFSITVCPTVEYALVLCALESGD
jgi:hypothetical protein